MTDLGSASRLLGIRPGPIGIVDATAEFLGVELRLRTALETSPCALLIAHPVGRGIPVVPEHAVHLIQTLAAGLAIVLVRPALLNGQMC